MASHRNGATTLTLRDGRRLYIPGSGDSFASAKNRATALDLMSIRPATRVRLDDDSVVVVAAMRRSHPVDLAILAALGVDVEAEMAKRRDDAEWTAPGWARPQPRPVRMIVTMDGRLTASVEIGQRLQYFGLTFRLRGDLPAATVASMRGRSLAEVIDIPRLRHLELPIRTAERGDNLCLPDDQAHVVITVGDESGWNDMG